MTRRQTRRCAVRGIVGDRGPAWVKRGASMQSKVQNVLALAVVALIGGGFLVWYYTGLAATPAPVEETRAQTAVQGEMTLPPLGPAPQRVVVVPTDEPSNLVDEGSAEAEALLAGGAAGGRRLHWVLLQHPRRPRSIRCCSGGSMRRC